MRVHSRIDNGPATTTMQHSPCRGGGGLTIPPSVFPPFLIYSAESAAELAFPLRPILAASFIRHLVGTSLPPSSYRQGGLSVFHPERHLIGGKSLPDSTPTSRRSWLLALARHIGG